jgi:thiamine transporter ThiT
MIALWLTVNRQFHHHQGVHVTRSGANPLAIPQTLGLGDARLYLAIATMVMGNLLLPLALHRIPDAGRVFLPILFFTLIAGWRFGAKAGLLSGVLSPLANHFLTGMPPTAVLQALMVQSALLGVLAAVIASRSRRLTLPIIALVVLLHQALILVPEVLRAGMRSAFATFELHLPGILLQILGGFALLWFLGRKLPQTPVSTRQG